MCLSEIPLPQIFFNAYDFSTTMAPGFLDNHAFLLVEGYKCPSEITSIMTIFQLNSRVRHCRIFWLGCGFATQYVSSSLDWQNTMLKNYEKAICQNCSAAGYLLLFDINKDHEVRYSKYKQFVSHIVGYTWCILMICKVFQKKIYLHKFVSGMNLLSFRLKIKMTFKLVIFISILNNK